MDPVRLVERRILGDAVEEERIERDAVLVGETLEGPSNCLAYSGPKLRGASMPASHTVTPACFSLATMASRLRRWSPPDRGHAGRRWRPTTITMSGLSASIQSTRARPPAVVSRRYSVVDDRDVAAGCLERRFEAGRDRLVGLEAIARQAVAQEGEPGRRGLCMGNREGAAEDNKS